MTESVESLRRRRIREWQEGERKPRFTAGTAPMILWPRQRQRADETLAVENLRRAYLMWKHSRRRTR